MTMYAFHQETPKSVWIPTLASERANTLKTKKPALITVLDVDSTFDEDMTAEQRASVKYSGPMYFDIDSEDIETAIEQTKKLLTLIKSKGVELDMLRCFLSGGRGVHILMDAAIFMPKIPPAGIANLPAIYKEMVWSTLFVDDVDMRVYSQGRGRMLRCSNVQRENGLYRVGVTADEILSLTPERYAELCSSPRNDVPVEPPKFCPDLGLAYSMASDKVSKAVTRKKAKKTACDDLSRFKNDWPETLRLVITGVGLKDDVGFNQVAMQVAITGLALGMNEDKILADCQMLIDEHKGDSSRYGTPAKRKSFLREMIRYVDGSPLYEFSAGGVLSLLITEVRGNSDLNYGEWVPDPDRKKKEPKPKAEPVVNEDGTVTKPEPEPTPEEDYEEEGKWSGR